MGLLDTIVTRLGYTKSAVVQDPPHILRAEAEAERFTIPDYSLYHNQAELYQRLSWVQIAVSMTAQTAAGTPLSVRRRRGEDLRDIPNHEFERLLARPNPLMSRFELLEATYAYRALTGNAYWWLNRPNAGTAPYELWVIPSHRIVPVPDERLYLRGYLYDAGIGRPIPLDPWEVCHFRRFHPLNSFVGLSPIEALAVVSTGDLAMQKWNTNFFGADNAKLPGFLAFSDPIAADRWGQLKADIKEQYTGTKRSLMMMQNVGKGGIEWISTSMSQKDMEFLAARTFNREEIFSVFAPGLSSVLAVNATEANATAGKSTFLEFAVYPQQIALAEKITNDILPSYGQNLVASFDDIRPVDRALKLKELEAYERSHTLDEVRKEHYGDPPVGDARGALLAKEVGAGATDTRTPEQRAAESPDPAPSDPTPAELPRGGKALDLERWQRKALKRVRAGKSAACDFDSDVLLPGEIEVIAAALPSLTTAPEVNALFAALQTAFQTASTVQ